MKDRRTFLKQAGLAGLAGFVPLNPLLASNIKADKFVDDESAAQWPDGSRLVVSVSMQFEAGGQPVNAESPFPQNMQKGFTDLPGGHGINMDIKKEFQECLIIGINLESKLRLTWSVQQF